jgi:hypothetical protein
MAIPLYILQHSPEKLMTASITSLTIHGADLSKRTNKSVTVLMLAAQPRGHDDCVHALLESGAEVDCVDDFEFTALMHGWCIVLRTLLLCVGACSPQCLFLKYGLDINVTILRKVLEASHAEAEAKEVISRDTHESLTRSQGHSAQTAKTYYDNVGKEAAMGIVAALDNTSHCALRWPLICILPVTCPLEWIPCIVSRHFSYEGLLDWNAFGDSYTGKSNAFALCSYVIRMDNAWRKFVGSGRGSALTLIKC